MTLQIYELQVPNIWRTHNCITWSDDNHLLVDKSVLMSQLKKIAQVIYDEEIYTSYPMLKRAKKIVDIDLLAHGDWPIHKSTNTGHIQWDPDEHVESDDINIYEVL